MMIKSARVGARKFAIAMGFFRKGAVNNMIHLATKAGAAMSKQDWAEASKYWVDIIDAYGLNTPTEVWVNSCVCLRNQGRFSRAEQLVNKGIKANPQNIALKNERAEIAVMKKDWPEAARRWQEIIDKFGADSRVATAHARLPLAYANSGDFEQAEKVIKNSRKVFPKDLSVLVSNSQISMVKGDWPEAAKRWKEALDILKDRANGAVWSGLVECLRKSGDLKEADKVAKEGVVIHPNDVYLRMEYAEVASTRLDWPEAAKRWQEVSDNINSYNTLRLWVKLQIRANLSVIKRILEINKYKTQIDLHRRSNRKRKIVVYTAFTQGYDTLKPPEVIDQRFDYIVYTDSQVDGMNIFDVRPLNQPNLLNDGSRASRYPKTHPHVLFKEYDVAIWVDASMTIVGDIMPIIEEFLLSGHPIGNPTHPHRQSLAEEIEACIDLEKDDPKILKKQLSYYRKVGFETNDLVNNGVILFNLKHKKLAPILESWWDQILTYSKRDQLSLNYALSKNKATRYHMTSPPEDIRNHPLFIFTPHQSEHTTLAHLQSLLIRD